MAFLYSYMTYSPDLESEEFNVCPVLLTQPEFVGEETMTKSVRIAKENDIPAIMKLLKQVNRIHYEGRPDLLITVFP